ncbi:MAG: glycosyltransferase family 2 protein [Bacteroidia bacterium]|nr:glycosyltransferase family 2 protein [Bacteroidia bacterium]
MSLIIPCYNEELGLPFVLEKVPAWIDEVILVDNNSTDLTAEIGRKFGARVFREEQQGYGFAYHKGFREAKGDIFVTLDGDGTYPVEEIEPLITRLLQDQLDFISACRFPLQNPKNMDVVSKFGNWVLTTLTEILFRYRLRDSQSGMWVFRSAILPRLTLQSNGMPFSEEIKIEAIRRGLIFREIHIPYYERYGEKKIKKFRDGLRNLIHLFQMRFRK